MRLKLAVSLFALLGALTLAYDDNCKGSSRHPSIHDCELGIATKVHPDAMYTDGFDFSYRSCFLTYRTDGEGDHALSGKKIMDTATRIINECRDDKNRGSFGTGNCEKCHVTVNFLSNCHAVDPWSCMLGLYQMDNDENAPRFTDVPDPKRKMRRGADVAIDPPPPPVLKGVGFAA